MEDAVGHGSKSRRKAMLLGEESHQPQPGATVVPAEYSGENEWVLRADLAATTDSSESKILPSDSAMFHHISRRGGKNE